MEEPHTNTHRGWAMSDPFAPRERPGSSFMSALLATALFRCWHILLFFSAWSALITILNKQGYNLAIQATLLTVLGTVLGFVISYRTTSSFERYNEGRRSWSQIILASRTFARTVWFHVPDPPADEKMSAEEVKARALFEKKTAVNLLEAFAVAVKHYLRGEDSIYYKDLYYLVKFLPAYALPHGMPNPADIGGMTRESIDPHSPPASPPASPRRTSHPDNPFDVEKASAATDMSAGAGVTSDQSLPLPSTAKVSKKASFKDGPSTGSSQTVRLQGQQIPEKRRHRRMSSLVERPSVKRRNRAHALLTEEEEKDLLPAYLPPKYALFDLFPFSLLIQCLTNRGAELKGKKAARLRAKLQSQSISHNLPLEITLYLSSYVSALQQRKIMDVPTTNVLLLALNQLVDSLTSLERILTTPIPYSYSVHLWLVTLTYNLALPFQAYPTLGWATIPLATIVAFFFFGFLVAGEEIENPFGYDKNDLNMDHFTHNIIRNELQAITSAPPPDPSLWAFNPENNMVFSADPQADAERMERLPPQEWIKRGIPSMRAAMKHA